MFKGVDLSKPTTSMSNRSSSLQKVPTKTPSRMESKLSILKTLDAEKSQAGAMPIKTKTTRTSKALSNVRPDKKKNLFNSSKSMLKMGKSGSVVSKESKNDSQSRSKLDTT